MKSLYDWCVENNKQYLIDEWDYKKNQLSPKEVAYGTHKKAWWICKNNHSFYSIISNRTGHLRGCPYCSHQKILKGENDLETICPKLAKEWHPIKNGKLRPSDVFPGSHKKAWWICENKHEWEAVIKSRVNGIGCPYCANKLVLKGFNDFETKYPEISKEWHPIKNNGKLPSDFTYGSGKIAWWLCKNGHEYKASLYNRGRTGCPICTRYLRTSFPEQAIYYYIKQVYPDAINGYKEIFDKGMELDIYIPSIKVGIEYDGCIYHNENNLKRDNTKYEICHKNGIQLIRVEEYTLRNVFKLYDRKISVKPGDMEHLNQAIYILIHKLNKKIDIDVIKDRQKIISQYDKRSESLLSKYPEIAKEWDYEKNYPMIPENFAPHSNEKVSWICSKCSFEWKAAIGDRTRKECTGCPRCSRKIISQSKSRPIINITTGELFSSLEEAKKKYPKASHIGEVCRGKRNVSGGCKWMYKD